MNLRRVCLSTLFTVCAGAYVNSPSTRRQHVDARCRSHRTPIVSGQNCPQRIKIQHSVMYGSRLPPLHSVSVPESSLAVGESAEKDVLDMAIVGAGPAGLALAVALRRRGLRIKVFEAVQDIRERGAALYLQSFGLACLEEIKPGLANEVIAAGRPVQCLHLMRPSGDTIAKVDISVVERAVGFPSLCVTRYALQEVLMKHLSSEDVEFDCRLEGLSTRQEDGLQELAFEGRADTVRARTVVGADGRRSKVRQKVLADREPPCDWALTWWALADMDSPPAPPGELRMSYSTKRAIYYGEAEDGRTMWSFTCWRAGEIEQDPELRANRALAELKEWPDEVKNMVRSTPSNKLIEVYVGDKPLQWLTWSRDPGVTLIGDAAHAMLPSLGMGVTSAFQDVKTLAQCIEGPQTPLVQALAQYQRARRIPTALLQLASRIAMVFVEYFLCK